MTPRFLAIVRTRNRKKISYQYTRVLTDYTVAEHYASALSFKYDITIHPLGNIILQYINGEKVKP